MADAMIIVCIQTSTLENARFRSSAQIFALKCIVLGQVAKNVNSKRFCHLSR